MPFGWHDQDSAQNHTDAPIVKHLWSAAASIWRRCLLLWGRLRLLHVCARLVDPRGTGQGRDGRVDAQSLTRRTKVFQEIARLAWCIQGLIWNLSL